MADNLTPAERSECMGRIRGKDTSPEMLVRRALHRLGFRFRLHRRELPGSPDLVFPARRKAVWVHGCFWHWHADPQCPIAKLPKSREGFWARKLARNRARDEGARTALAALGWSSLTVWECQLRPRPREAAVARIAAFLDTVDDEEAQGRVVVLRCDGLGPRA